jgi:predicted nucleic acid-binding protein
MMKPVLLFDTSIVIDLLAKREPFWQSASQLFDLAEQTKVDAYINTLTLVTVYYILRSHYKILHQRIIDAFLVLTSYVSVADVKADHVRQAMMSSFTDFEDGVMFYSGVQIAGITAIITRNVPDFSTADIPVLTPDQWLANYHNH